MLSRMGTECKVKECGLEEGYLPRGVRGLQKVDGVFTILSLLLVLKLNEKVPREGA